jgi:hypothetical protein
MPRKRCLPNTGPVLLDIPKPLNDSILTCVRQLQVAHVAPPLTMEQRATYRQLLRTKGKDIAEIYMESLMPQNPVSGTRMPSRTAFVLHLVRLGLDQYRKQTSSVAAR